MASNPFLPGDDTFGPQLPGKFDFTITFEDGIFSIGPTALFILYAIPYVRKLMATKPCVRFGSLLAAKVIVATCYFAIQVSMLALWAQDSTHVLRTTLASAAMSVIGALFIGGVLYAAHRYSPQPCIPLSIYLSITLLLDIATTRSYFLRNDIHDIAALSAARTVLKLALVISEEITKTRWIDREKFPNLRNESMGGFWSRALLLWLNQILLIGFKRPLKVADLQHLDAEFSSERLYNAFEPVWAKDKKDSRFALPRVWFRLFFWDIIGTVIPRICVSGFLLAQPFLLLRLVTAVGQKDNSTPVTGGLCGAAAIIYLGAALSNSLYKQLNNRVVAYTRGTLVAALYQKSLKLSHEQLAKSSTLTLMNADIDGVEGFLSMMHDIWASAIELGIGLFILATFIGPACVLMLVPTTISTYMGTVTTNRMVAARRLWNEHIDTRVGATSDVLSQLKGVKISGMTAAMSDNIRQLRNDEIKISMKERWVRIMMHGTSQSVSPQFLADSYLSEGMAPVVVLAGAIFWTRASDGLSVAEVFTIISVVIIVTDPLVTLLMFLPAVSSGYTCSYRIQQFLQLEEIPIRPVADAAAAGKAEAANDAVITFDNAALDDFSGNVVFKDVNLEIPLGQISTLVGTVGCGKSALFRSVLGETPLASGMVRVAADRIAYCDQTPWLQNKSIRDNIIAQSQYVPARYQAVLHACALDEDILQLPEGDQTKVGTGGCSLSGGQRQRVALARAAYSDTKVVLLDDVVTALDTRTSKAVLERLFGDEGRFRQDGITVFMVSSSFDCLTVADNIFTFTDKGTVEKTDKDFGQLAEDSELLKWLDSARADERDEDRESGMEKQPQPASRSNAEEEDAARQKGDVSLYFYYIKSTGWVLIIAWLASMAFAAVVDRTPLIFLRIWMGKDPQNNLYFIGYAVFGVMTILVPCSTIGIYYLRLVPRSSSVLHERLLQAVMRSRWWYFTKLDTGSIMNRFSSDITIISTTLPKVFMQASFLFFQIPTDVGIIVAGAKYAAAFIPLLLLSVYVIQFFYLRTSRQMRFLDLEAQAPLLTHFAETASGIQHVRAFNWNREFARESLEWLDHSQRPYYYMFCIQTWLALVLDLSIMAMAVAVIAFALNYKHTTSEAAVGLSMINIITLSGRMGVLVRSWVEMETSLGAISRTREFVRKTPVEDSDAKAVSGWPHDGSIELRQVAASYNSQETSSKPVINDISLQINDGDKVGIVGRTGSGKSSLMLALLNFLDYTGSITIGGEELSSMPHEILRERIVSVSQEGIHLTGSLRKNLYPYDTSDSSSSMPSDDALIRVLSTVCLWDSITSRGYNLDTALKDIKPSTGQLQLMAVARAMLRRERNGSRIVLIDEAISSVDGETAKTVQAAMEESFKECTVITIAHRLETVESCGLVVEMEAGRIVRVLDRRDSEGQTGRVEDEPEKDA